MKPVKPIPADTCRILFAHLEGPDCDIAVSLFAYRKCANIREAAIWTLRLGRKHPMPARQVKPGTGVNEPRTFQADHCRRDRQNGSYT